MLDLRKIFTVGQNTMVRKVVQKSDTAANYSKEMNMFLSTPSCIDMVIKAAMETVDQFLPDGFVSIGHSMEFTHTAPTILGMTVTVRVQIIEVTEREILLEIKAWDEQGEVGHGYHRRSVVNRDDLIKKAKERTRFLTNRRLYNK